MPAFNELISLIGIGSPKVVVFLFVICILGELTVPIPYLLESVWLLSGYELIRGVLSPVSLIFYWLAAQLGRQTGALVLYYLSQFGSVRLRGIFKRAFSYTLQEQGFASKILHRLNNLSPLTVAAGRMLALRVPLTIALGAAGKFRTLMFGIVLSSLVFDGAYIIIGSTAGITAAKPANILWYFFGGLTVLYLLGFVISMLRRMQKQNRPG